MNLGWIDFSDSDRKKTMDVLRLFQEQGAVDELGIGVIRDGFANYFFPGTSTIQTRAKYFFIIPYAMMDTVRDTHVSSVQQALRRLDELEKESAVILKKNSDEQGIIGATVLPKWVVRTPSTIYWNGLRTLGIFNAGLFQNISISEYFRLAIKLREEKKASTLGNRKEDAEENNKDDVDAGDFLQAGKGKDTLADIVIEQAGYVYGIMDLVGPIQEGRISESGLQGRFLVEFHLSCHVFLGFLEGFSGSGEYFFLAVYGESPVGSPFDDCFDCCHIYFNPISFLIFNSSPRPSSFPAWYGTG